MREIVLLMDNYGPDSQSLHSSLKLAGIEIQSAVIEEDGFLPGDVMSAYGFFLGDFRKKMGKAARPKYFNEITVPDFWEISGTNSSGKVHDLYRERGRIFYAEPKHKRLVRIVDWLDERGVVRSSDHYNCYGAIYARTIFNAKGQKVNKSYFSADGQEIIVENFVTGDIILNEDGGVRIFRTKTDFVVHFLMKAGFKHSRVFFNSLSTPFFVSNRLEGGEKRDVLFWQEPVGGEIPGNMQIILKGQASRAAQIIVQKRESYDKLIALGANPQMVHRLGFIYPFEKENAHQPQALICTNSDNIEHCQEIVKALSQIHFHIAALTEMSSRLLGMESLENVSLYPGAKPAVLEELFGKCDFYLDINHEAEIVSAVRRAFLSNHLIFAFNETIHNRDYVAQEHIYPAGEAERMISQIRLAAADEKVMEEGLAKQRKAALTETADGYAQLGRM